MKKFLTLGNILLCAAALLGIVSVFLMFAPGLTYSVDTGLGKMVSTFSGVQITFGYKEVIDVPYVGTVESEAFKFSFMNLLPYLLVIVGLVLAVLSIFFKCKYIAPVAAVCFLLAGVFFFCAVPFTVLGEEGVTKDAFALGAGTIVSGIFAIISAICCALKTFVFKN